MLTVNFPITAYSCSSGCWYLFLGRGKALTTQPREESGSFCLFWRISTGGFLGLMWANELMVFLGQEPYPINLGFVYGANKTSLSMKVSGLGLVHLIN